MVKKSTDREAFYKSKPVLVFSGSHILISLVASVRCASLITGIRANSISFACNGKQISAGEYFFRHLNDDIEIEREDYGILTIQEYDSLCQVERKYHTPQAMQRKKLISQQLKENKQ